MNNSNNVDFKSLRLSGVKKEAPNEMDTSFFSDVYKQARSIITSIVECNNENSRSASRTSETQNCINNVMAFIGRRGTGKTSAMLSVSEYYAANENNIKDKMFYSLPYTDVSVFEENEDIFIITLSKMFAYLSGIFENGANLFNPEKYDAYQKIRDKICTVYDHYVSFKGSDIHRLNSSYNLMEKVQNRYNVHDEFEELVKDYIQLLNTASASSSAEGYLIICLDDIDMTRYNHINVMQCIHQFFMIPNVIVMVTMRVSILSAALQKEFFANLHTIPLTDESNIKLSREQQEDYLRKIIPSGMRITMPSWRKRDYQTINQIKVVFKKSDKEIIFEKFRGLIGSKLFNNFLFKANSEEIYSISPKELIMIMLSDRTGIYLDAQGRKYHFMEPDSLRGLYDLFYLMYNMESVSKDVDKPEDALKSNFKIILDYLHFKMIPEGHYEEDLREYIKSFLEEPIDRRGEKIWNYFFKCLNNNVDEQRITSLFGRSFFQSEAEKYKIENYCMGEVYRGLYYSTRLGLTKMNRNLVKFVLASFSFTFPQFIKEELLRIKNSKGNNKLPYSNSLLCNLFGYSLIGEWRKDLFNGSEVDIVVDRNEFCSLFTGSKQIKNKKDRIDQFFKQFLYLILLTSKAPGEITEVHVKRYNITRNDNESLHYHFEINADPTAFIINSLDVDDRIDKMKFKFEGESISEGVTALFKTILNKDIEDKGLKSILDGLDNTIKTLKEEIKKELLSENCNLQFLLEQTDLSYNVIKRSITKLIYGGTNNLNAKKYVADSPLKSMADFYDNMGTYLKQQDKVYFLSSPDDGFNNKFRSNPVVQSILSLNAQYESSLLGLGYSNNYEFSETLEYCFNSLQDIEGGVFYTDIQALKQYYKDYLNIRVAPELRRQISIFIELYRNDEFRFADIINEINKLLNISFVETPTDYVTLADCLSLLETEDNKYNQDIFYISLEFKSFLNKELAQNEVSELLSALRKYINSEITFEALLAVCRKCMNMR